MKKTKNIILLTLIIIPLVSLYYKSKVLNLSLLPKAPTDSWILELSHSENNESPNDLQELSDFKLPIPTSSLSQKIKYLKLSPQTRPENKSNDFENRGQVLSLTAHLKLFGQKSIKSETNNELLDEEVSEYTAVPALEEDTMAQLEELSDSIVFPNDSDFEKVKKIFFYISDEFVLQPKTNDLSDILTLKTGSYLGQAKLVTALIRLNKIPARVSFGVQILEPTDNNSNRFIRVFYSEAFVDGRWIPINPHQKELGVFKNDFIILTHDAGKFADSFNNRDLLSIYVKPLSYGSFNSKDYLKGMEDKPSFYSLISLHRFPISIQSIFFGLLLIPFGTVILSFMRVVIGVNTFGIFTPILLTLFFLETSLAFGLSFFVLVVLFGLSQRALLDKFYLLAVPRLSVILALVIIMYTGFALFMDHFGLLSSGKESLSYFPIVIITVFIERFSIYFIEEGAVNTLKTTFGTFVVAVLCYLLLSVTWLKALLFNNPELILFSIGLNLILGSYKGYRLLEFIRFSELKGSN